MSKKYSKLAEGLIAYGFPLLFFIFSSLIALTKKRSELIVLIVAALIFALLFVSIIFVSNFFKEREERWERINKRATSLENESVGFKRELQVFKKELNFERKINKLENRFSILEADKRGKLK